MSGWATAPPPRLSWAEQRAAVAALAAFGPAVRQPDGRWRRPPPADPVTYLRLRNRLVLANLWRVKRAVALHRHPGHPADDLLQAGAVGLIQAIDRYHPAVHGHLGQYLWFRVRTAVRLAVATGRRRPCRPLAAGSPADGDPAVAAAEAEAAAVRPAVVRAVVATLSPRQALVVRRRFGLGAGPPATLAQVAEVLGMTRERVRQLEVAALNRLAHPRRARRLEAVAP